MHAAYLGDLTDVVSTLPLKRLQKALKQVYRSTWDRCDLYVRQEGDSRETRLAKDFLCVVFQADEHGIDLDRAINDFLCEHERARLTAQRRRARTA